MTICAAPAIPAVCGSAERFVSSSGIVWRRAGTGPLAVLLHGSGGSWRHWTRNLPGIAGSRTAILPDLPGFGESADIEQDVSLEEYVAIVSAALAEAMDKRAPIDAIGFSFGGLVAAGLACASGTRVRAALCLETRPDARVDLVERGGHWVAYERAAETNRLIARFLDDPRAGAAGAS